MNILNNQQFLKGQITTTFVDDNPGLLKFVSSVNKVQKILDYLAEVVINGPTTPFLNKIEPHFIRPYIPGKTYHSILNTLLIKEECA